MHVIRSQTGDSAVSDNQAATAGSIAHSAPTEVDSKARKALWGSAIGYAMDGFDLLILGFMLRAISAVLTVLFTSVNFHGIKSSTLQKLLKRVTFLMFTLRTLTEKQRRFLLDLRRLRTILGQSLNQRLM